MVEYNSDVGHDTGGAMVGETQGSVRWGIECRFEFIEFRLFWKGHVNRGDLMPVSGISINQASATSTLPRHGTGGHALWPPHHRPYPLKVTNQVLALHSGDYLPTAGKTAFVQRVWESGHRPTA